MTKITSTSKMTKGKVNFILYSIAVLLLFIAAIISLLKQPSVEKLSASEASEPAPLIEHSSEQVSSTPLSPPQISSSQPTASVEKSYAEVDVAMSLVKVAEHTWYVQGKAGVATDNAGFISNAGFVVTDKGVVVFDALGTPSLANKLVQKIKEVTTQPIVKVVVSHYHADHIYGLQVFKELGAEIIAPEGVLKYIESEAATSRLEERQFSLDPWVNEDTYVVMPNTIMEKSSTLTVGSFKFGINIIGSAHSDGDLTMFVEKDRVLFTGDLIFEGRVPFLGSNNTKHWLETLVKMEEAKVHALIPGHGPAAKEPMKAITMTRTYLAFLREKMGEAVEELTDFEEAYDAIDWSAYEKLPAFEAANRKNAFQVYLSMEEEAID